MTLGQNAIFPAAISGVASRKRKYQPTNSTEESKRRVMTRSSIIDTMEVIYRDIFDPVNCTPPDPATAPPLGIIEWQPQDVSEPFAALTDKSTATTFSDVTFHHSCLNFYFLQEFSPRVLMNGQSIHSSTPGKQTDQKRRRLIPATTTSTTSFLPPSTLRIDTVPRRLPHIPQLHAP